MWFHMFTLLNFTPPWRLVGRKRQSFKMMGLRPSVSRCFIQFPHLFHAASSLFVSIKQPWESCPFLSEDIALLTGSVSHPRYCLWWATCVNVKQITAPCSYLLNKTFFTSCYLFLSIQNTLETCCPLLTHKDYKFEVLSYKKKNSTMNK